MRRPEQSRIGAGVQITVARRRETGVLDVCGDPIAIQQFMILKPLPEENFAAIGEIGPQERVRV